MYLPQPPLTFLIWQVLDLLHRQLAKAGTAVGPPPASDAPPLSPDSAAALAVASPSAAVAIAAAAETAAAAGTLTPAFLHLPHLLQPSSPSQPSSPRARYAHAGRRRQPRLL